jgi:hypothetical protein
MVRIAFDVNDVGAGVLGAVAERVNQDAASDGTVSAGVPRLLGVGELEGANVFRDRLTATTKPERSHTRSRKRRACELYEASTSEIHAGRSIFHACNF